MHTYVQPWKPWDSREYLPGAWGPGYGAPRAWGRYGAPGAWGPAYGGRGWYQLIPIRRGPTGLVSSVFVIVVEKTYIIEIFPPQCLLKS